MEECGSDEWNAALHHARDEAVFLEAGIRKNGVVFLLGKNGQAVKVVAAINEVLVASGEVSEVEWGFAASVDPRTMSVSRQPIQRVWRLTFTRSTNFFGQAA